MTRPPAKATIAVRPEHIGVKPIGETLMGETLMSETLMNEIMKDKQAVRFPLSRNVLKWLRVGLLGSSLTWAGYSFGLGLGEIELDSALNEKFDAQIELIDAHDLEPTEILVSLASGDDFDRLGVERFFYLTDLKFEVVRSARGETSIAVSSSRPIAEPYLNFLIQLHWPNGRLVKEYTVLMDPPTFTQIAAPAIDRARQVPAPTSQAGPVTRDSQPSQSASRQSPSVAAPSQSTEGGTRLNLNPAQPTREGPTRQAQNAQDGFYRMTDRNDTLWNIAKDTLPSEEVSVQQNMLALQRLNPNAFIRGNINLMKAGYVLRLATLADAQSLSRLQAAEETRAQVAEWRAVSRGEKVAERSSATKLIEEEGASFRSQVDGTDAAEVVSANEASVEAKPAQTSGQLRIVATDADSTTGTVSSGEGQPGLAGSLEERDRLSREVEALSGKLDRQAEVTSAQIEVMDRQIQLKDQEIAQLQARLAEVQTQSVSASAPAATTAADTPWWNSPLAIGGGFGALVLALFAVLMGRRRRTDDPEPLTSSAVSERVAAAVSSKKAPAISEPAQTDSKEEATFVVPAIAAAAKSRPEDHEDENPDSQTSDVIGEAEIYIAYGRYPQAISLLNGVLADAPGRNDIRLKLLEIHADTADRQAFDSQMEALLANSDDQDVLLSAREIESRFSGEDDEPVIDHEQATATTSEAASDDLIDFTSDTPEDTTDVTDDLVDLQTPDPQTADLDEDLAELENLVQTRKSGIGAGLEFDLDLDDELLEQEKERSQMNFDRLDSTEENLTTPDDGAQNTDDDDSSNIADGFDLEDLTFDDEDTESLATHKDRLVPEEDFNPDDGDFDFEDDADSSSTKLDLARAYIDMGDKDGARDILQEVLSEGSQEQTRQAESLLEKL